MGDIFNFGQFDYSKIDPRLVRHVSITEKTEYSYLSSYKESADELLSIATQKMNIEAEIFPIVFLYRKYLETLLNQIIEKIEEANKEDKKHSEQYKGNHENLEQMFDYIEDTMGLMENVKGVMYLDNVSLEIVHLNFKKTVLAFHKIDPKSSDPKHFYKKDFFTFDDRITVDVIKMKEAIQEIHEFLVSPV